MKALFLLASDSLSRDVADRAVVGLKYRIPNASITFGCAQENLSQHKSLFSDVEFVVCEEVDLSVYNIVVFLKGQKELVHDGKGIDFNKCRIYYADSDGLLKLGNPIYDLTENPHRDSHSFNKIMSETEGDRFSVFPGGYLYRILYLGPTNEFGFRINKSIEDLAEREENHKVITFFGGSGAWSTLSLYNESFTVQLEERLNKYGQTLKNPLKFTVINFAQPHALVLNEMNNFLLWGYKCRPDLVVSHGGANDFASGQVSDSALLNKDKITYQFYYEAWAKTLAKSSLPLMSEKAGQMAATNLPRAIVAAYIERLKQFETVVRAYKSSFLHALQPFALSKKELSPVEDRRLKKVSENSPYMVLIQNLHFIYEKFLEVRQRQLSHPLLNLHGDFEKFGAECTLFGDYIHTLPEGDKVISQHYFEYLKTEFIPKWELESTRPLNEKRI